MWFESIGTLHVSRVNGSAGFVRTGSLIILDVVNSAGFDRIGSANDFRFQGS